MALRISLIMLAAATAVVPAACQQATSTSAAAGGAAAAAAAQPIVLTAADGVAVYALHTVAAHPRATILLFHQAGASKAEYVRIAPRLAAAGFDCLAVDQRSGGGANETVRALGRSTDFLAAAPDFEAAFAWARARGRPVVIWGSSYSSSMAIMLAARHRGQVAAVLAFSPGEYFADDHVVTAAAARVDAPVFVTSAQSPSEIAAARAILSAVPGRANVQFVPTAGGAHGSATLDPDRNRGGAEAVWQATLAFLNRAIAR